MFALSICSKKPKGFSFEAAACIPLGSLTGYRATISLQTFREKGAIFIARAVGGIGCMAVQLLRYFHGAPIYILARSEETVKFLVEKLYIEKRNIVLYKDMTIEQVQEKLVDLNKEKLLSSVLDFVGKEMKELCISIADYSGEILLIVPEEQDIKLPLWANGAHISSYVFRFVVFSLAWNLFLEKRKSGKCIKRSLLILIGCLKQKR